MKLKFTHPVPEKGYQAGLVYDVLIEEAQEYLKADIAIPGDHERDIRIEYDENDGGISIPEASRQKKKTVKYDNG